MTDVGTVSVTPRWKIVLLQLIVLYLLGLKLWFGLVVTPMGDEAYYWMWGQHPSWSYFDHPPLNGWLQGVVAAIFGWSNLSVRLTSWLTLIGTLWILWLWSARLAPDDREGWFWHSAAIYLTIPVVFLMSSFAFHDHLLMFFAVASIYAFHGFVSDWEDGVSSWRKLYIAAALLGLAVLTKYNGVFLGLGYAIYVLARPKLRGLLLTPHLWLAALLAIAMQAPVIYWNLGHDAASLRYHLLDRSNVAWGTPRFDYLLSYIGTTLVLASPILLVAAARIPFLRRGSVEERQALGMGGTIFLASTIAWAAIAMFVYVYFHWNIVAYVALGAIAYRLLGGHIALAAHVAYGIVLITVAMLNYTVTPMKLLGFGDTGAAAAHGWVELGQRVSAQQAAHPEAFLATTRYTYSAQLGFVLREIDVAALNPVRSQNDYWWDAAGHAGQDAIVVGDAAFPIDDAKGRFASVEKLETVQVRDWFGTPIWSFDIWIGRSFRPAAP